MTLDSPNKSQLLGSRRPDRRRKTVYLEEAKQFLMKHNNTKFRKKYWRSPYFSHAKRALYHLSYIPILNRCLNFHNVRGLLSVCIDIGRSAIT